MKDGIHPAYVTTTVTCSCGNTFKTRSTKKELKDGEAHQFADLGASQATYLYRELEAAAAADVATSITSPGTLTVWVNGEKGRLPDLVTKESFADCEVHVEFLIAKNSNSGIKLHAVYEIQILGVR